MHAVVVSPSTWVVYVEVTPCEEFHATLFTLVVPDTTVYQGVCGEVTLFGKSTATLLTLIIPDITVQHGMCVESCITHGGAWSHSLHRSTTPGATRHNPSCRDPQGSQLERSVHGVACGGRRDWGYDGILAWMYSSNVRSGVPTLYCCAKNGLEILQKILLPNSGSRWAEPGLTLFSNI
ncbi:hypothetical protein E2C01_046478 [Portunus trituberculatus]|uniref:Uncharacterized protein n=1 Tax=Portunus trituberculatus TaxID=210409 RepID=A0A5B7G503_PORTR|nr:hypothetical protein [Portunus trituberculatus]